MMMIKQSITERYDERRIAIHCQVVDYDSSCKTAVIIAMMNKNFSVSFTSMWLCELLLFTKNMKYECFLSRVVKKYTHKKEKKVL
jgi:hypothetical protein